MIPKPPPIENIPRNNRVIVCSFCLDRCGWKSGRPCIDIPGSAGCVPCDSCEILIDNIITEIFGEEWTFGIYDIKDIDLEWAQMDKHTLSFFDKIITKSEEYKLYIKLLKSLCIWNKPKVKL